MNKTFYVFYGVTNPDAPHLPQKKFVVEAIDETQAMSKAMTLLIEGGYTHDVAQAEKYDFAIEAGANEHHRIEVDLHKICPDLPTDNNGYCRGYLNKEGPYYGDWEKNVADPALKAQGYEKTWCWCDFESDSCGPLSRVTYAKKDGKFYEISYG